MLVFTYFRITFESYEREINYIKPSYITYESFIADKDLPFI